MNPRHAAALALVGWYLMYPPSQADTSWICGRSPSAEFARNGLGWGKSCQELARLLDSGAPLSQWLQAGEPFETLSECEEVRDKRLQEPGMTFARCIASDDPRLK
jgi:hypothetical protein